MSKFPVIKRTALCDIQVRQFLQVISAVSPINYRSIRGYDWTLGLVLTGLLETTNTKASRKTVCKHEDMGPLYYRPRKRFIKVVSPFYQSAQDPCSLSQGFPLRLGLGITTCISENRSSWPNSVATFSSVHGAFWVVRTAEHLEFVVTWLGNNCRLVSTDALFVHSGWRFGSCLIQESSLARQHPECVGIAVESEG